MTDRFRASDRPPEEPPRFTPVTADPRRGRVLRVLAAVCVALLLIGVGGAVLAVKLFVDAVPPLPEKSALLVTNQAPGMTFEDHTGKIIATRGPRHGHLVTLGELPPYVPRAFLAAEDRRFYKHGPVDLQGIARALKANLKAGRTVQGGSTLTQQLAKTLFLSPDQTIHRKLQEAVIAWRLEQAMSKNEVLELYLNRIFFGDNAYGLDAAAQIYFGKPASRLNLQEAAVLAAMPKAPTRLALTNDMDAALACDPRYRLSPEPVDPSIPAEALPIGLTDLLERSERLLDRVTHLDQRMFLDAAEDDLPHPVLSQHDKLKAAFGI